LLLLPISLLYPLLFPLPLLSLPPPLLLLLSLLFSRLFHPQR
jgi:hypothetical protein